jgi:LAO/AO transport system kinase
VVDAKRAAGDYRHALRMLPPATPGWTTPVLTFSARTGDGLSAVWDAVVGHRALLESRGELAARRAAQRQRWLERLLNETVLREFRSRAGFAEALAAAQAGVQSEELTVPQAVQQLLGAVHRS